MKLVQPLPAEAYCHASVVQINTKTANEVQTQSLLDNRDGTSDTEAPKLVLLYWSRLVWKTLGAFDLKHGYRRRSTRVAPCSRGRSWKWSRQAGHFLLPFVMFAYSITDEVNKMHRLFVKYTDVSETFLWATETLFIYCLIQCHLFKNNVQHNHILFKY